MCEETKAEEAPVVELASKSRRGFLGALVSVVGAVLVWPKALYAKKVGLSLAKVEALQSVGGSTTLKVKEHKILFVRDSETSIKGINPNCTHKKCTVKFTSKDGQLHCPCHKSAFSLEGAVLGGPAPKPLATFPVQLNGDQIVVTLPD